jgi:hypothetical protein
MKSKLFMILLIFIFLIINLYTAFLTFLDFLAERKTIIVHNQNDYIVQDATDQFKDYDHVKKVYIALDATKSYQIEFYSIKDYPSLFHSRGCSNINFNNTNTFSDENIYINNDDTSFKVKDDLNTTLDIQMDEYKYKESPFPNTTDVNDNIPSNLNAIQSQLLNQNNALNSLLNYNLCSLTNYSLLYPLYFNNLSAISPYLYLKLQQYFLALQLKEASSQIENNFLNNKRTRTQINLNSSNNNSLFINNQNEQNEHLDNIESNLSNSQNNFK